MYKADSSPLAFKLKKLLAGLFRIQLRNAGLVLSQCGLANVMNPL